jgi:tRNA(Ile2) C34 agmatinyltransferase TiaS
MKLSDLVAQILYEPPKKKVTLRDPLCPRCKDRPRSISKVSGRVADYCTECKQDYVSKLKVKKLLEEN